MLIRGQILRFKYSLDLQGNLPYQEFYSLRLKLKRVISRQLDTNKTKEFIHYALRHLPEGSFIIFHFDSSDDNFVQLCNLGGHIVLDIPLWDGNVYYSKEDEIIGFLKDMHFTRKSPENRKDGLGRDQYEVVSEGGGNKSFKANFGPIYIRATIGVMSLVKEIFGIENPTLHRYDSSRLTSHK